MLRSPTVLTFIKHTTDCLDKKYHMCKVNETRILGGLGWCVLSLCILSNDRPKVLGHLVEHLPSAWNVQIETDSLFCFPQEFCGM